MVSEDWKNFCHFAGIDINRNRLPMDACHLSTCFFAKTSIETWIKTHSGASKISFSSLKKDIYFPANGIKLFDGWLDAYTFGGDFLNITVDDIDVYKMEDSPFIFNVRDTKFWVLVAPMTELGVNLSSKPRKIHEVLEGEPGESMSDLAKFTDNTVGDHKNE